MELIQRKYKGSTIKDNLPFWIVFIIIPPLLIALALFIWGYMKFRS